MADTPNADKALTLHVWSGPRSLSTCMMYSFSRRKGCKVFDEPLYASYLDDNPQLYRPYRSQLIENSETNATKVISHINDVASSSTNEGNDLIYAKHMAKHLNKNVDRHLLFGDNIKHVILIRDPLDMIVSWSKKHEVHKENCSLDSTCLPQLLSLFSEVRQWTGVPPIIIDTSILLSSPHAVISEFCRTIGIPFYEEQLSWPAGPKPDIDGCDFSILIFLVYILFLCLVCGRSTGMTVFTNLPGLEPL